MSRPLLNPPCTFWKEDLPLPDDPCTTEPSLGYKSPNHQDSIYLEVSRAISWARELVILFTLPAIFIIATIPFDMIKSFAYLDSEQVFIGTLSLILETWVCVFLIRRCICPLATNPFVSTGNEKKSMPTTSKTVGGSLSEPGKSSQSATTGRKCAPSAGFTVACRETVRPVSNVGWCCPSSHPEQTTSSTGFP